MRKLDQLKQFVRLGKYSHVYAITHLLAAAHMTIHITSLGSQDPTHSSILANRSQFSWCSSIIRRENFSDSPIRDQGWNKAGTEDGTWRGSAAVCGIASSDVYIHRVSVYRLQWPHWPWTRQCPIQLKKISVRLFYSILVTL